MPSTLEAIIASAVRAAARPATVEAVALAMALVPPDTSDAVCAAVAGVSPREFIDACAVLLRGGVFLGHDFAHPLYREVARRELAPDLRRHVARRAIEILGPHHPELLADLVEDAEFGADDALRLLTQAAAQADADGRSQHAARLLARATACATGDEQAQIALQAAQALLDVNLADAARLAELAVDRRPGDARAVFTLARVRALQGRGAEAERLLDALPDGCRAGPEWWEQKLALRAQRGDAAGVLELWSGHPELQARAAPVTWRHVATAVVSQGDFARARQLLADAARHPALHAVDRASLLILDAAIFVHTGEYVAAESAYTQAVELFRAGGAVFQLARALGDRSFARWGLGDHAGAIADIVEGMRLFEHLGAGLRYAEQQSRLGAVLVEMGDYERAEGVLLESRAVMARADLSEHLAVCEGNLAYLYLEWAPPYGGALALRHAAAAVQYARRLGSLPTLTQILFLAAWAEAWHGDPARALALSQEAIDVSSRMGQVRSLALAMLARGLALEASGKKEDALAALREATARIDALGLPAWANRMGLEVDRLAGDAAAAERRLRFFQARNLHNGVRIAHRYFPHLAPHEPALPPPAALRLEVLGPFRLARQGAPIAFRAHKGKELLALLLEARIAGRREILQTDLLDLLYPGVADGVARPALQQLVHRVRSSLGAAAVVRTAAGYALGALESDAELFLRTGDPTLWRGPYLEDLGGGWDLTVRSALYHLLKGQAEALLAQDPRHALRLGRLLLEAEPCDRQALALVLTALRKTGNRAGLLALYHRARARFEEFDEMLPESWRTFLAAPGVSPE